MLSKRLSFILLASSMIACLALLLFQKSSHQQTLLDRFHLDSSARINKNLQRLLQESLKADFALFKSCLQGGASACQARFQGALPLCLGNEKPSEKENPETCSFFKDEVQGFEARAALHIKCLGDAHCEEAVLQITSQYEGWIPGLQTRNSTRPIRAEDLKSIVLAAPESKSDFQFSSDFARRWIKKHRSK